MEGVSLEMQNLTSCHHPELTCQYTNTVEKARELEVLPEIGDGAEGNGCFLSNRTLEGSEAQWT